MKELITKKFQIKLTKDNPILRDHRVENVSILPGVVYLDFVYRVLNTMNFDISKLVFKQIVFSHPLRLINNQDRFLRLRFKEESNSFFAIIESFQADKRDEFIQHFKSEIEEQIFANTPNINVQDLHAKKVESFRLTDIYTTARKFQIQHGPYMRAEGTLNKTEDQIFAELSLPSVHKLDPRSMLDSCLMDAATLVGLATFDISKLSNPLLPIYIEEFSLKKSLPSNIIVVAKRLDINNAQVGDLVTNSIQLYDENGVCLALITNLKGKAIRGKAKLNGTSSKMVSQDQNKIKVINRSDVTLELMKEDFIQMLQRSYDMPKNELKSDIGFYDLGLDSGALMTIGEKLERKVQTKIYPTLLFEYPTIGELVQYLYENYKDQYLFDLDEDIGAPSNSKAKPIEQPVGISSPSSNTKGEPYESQSADDIDENSFAIVGLQGRFPQAENMDEFWSNLEQGKNCIETVPKDRWDHSEFYEKEGVNVYKTTSQSGGFVKGIDLFDPLFFRLSGKEAERTDPQERCFMEMAYATMDDAGYTGRKYQQLKNEHQDKIGVFVGVMWNTYPSNAMEQSTGKNYELCAPFSFSIANRVSYFFDFKGPSYVINSACSSSLLAIHQACQEIKNGSCKWALAGGVNLVTHPSKYVFLSRFGMISPGDKNYSFSNYADGYVPGEGVGCVLIKPLKDALKHNDHIYGVIRGSAVNHGGKSAGYSIPNPSAQADVINQSLERANLQPKDISYVEAHGTGTPLGDPIEISALSRVFQNRTNPLLVGSVKSNIGHLESAAGIAGVAKVLQQFKHHKIVPSIHADELNEQIDFENKPIKIIQNLNEWKPTVNEKGETTRIAGVSSFGAGGTNVHVILEEAPSVKYLTSKVNEEGVFVLSSKNERTLKKYVRSVIGYLKNHEDELVFADVIYTFQEGRQAMNHRLAIVCSDLGELMSRAKVYLDAQSEPNIFKGKATTTNETVLDFATNGERAQAWVDGKLVNWNSGEERNGRMISLPPYPFDHKSYWIDVSQPVENTTERTVEKKLESDIQVYEEFLPYENLSTTNKTVFKFKFSGKESLITDHQFQEERVFPGAGYIALAIKAGRQALNINKPLAVKKIKFVRSLTLGSQEFELNIIFKKIEDNISFIIHNSDDESAVYCKGLISKIVEDKALVEANNFQSNAAVSSTELYQKFLNYGMKYGPSFQLINKLSKSEYEAESDIVIPNHLLKSVKSIDLIPQLLDVALQTTIGVNYHNNTGGVPISIQSIELYRPPTQKSKVFVRKRTNVGKRLIYDISVFNSNREIVINVLGYESLKIDMSLQYKKNNRIDLKNKEVIFFKQQWENIKQFSSSYEKQILVFDPSQRLETMSISDTSSHILVRHQEQFEQFSNLEFGCDFHDAEQYNQLISAIVSHGIDIKVIACISNVNRVVESTIDNLQEEKINWNYLFGLRLCQAISKNKLRTCKHLLWIGSTGSEDSDPSQESISGLLRSFQIELSGIMFKGLWTDQLLQSGIQMPMIETIIASEVRYLRNQKGNYSVATIAETVIPTNNEDVIKNQGVYLITGGASGVGKLKAKYLAETHHTRLILLGRRKFTEEIDNFIQELESLGGQAKYYSCDIANFNELKAVIQTVCNEFQNINGIIHSAGVIKDALLHKKTSEQMEQVFAPKITGLINLDLLTKDMNLDWIALNSSLSGVFGNLGQADYSVANSFMDHFAQLRNKAQKKGQRNGKTISINWPYWKEGGMRISEDQEQRLQRLTGMKPLETEEGITIFLKALQLDTSQTIVFKGDKEIYKKNVISKLQSNNQLFSNQEMSNDTPASTQPIPKASQEELVERLTGILANALKVEPDDIEPDILLEEYGLDSILMIQILDEVEDEIGFSVEPGTLMENPTINELVDYLLSNHQVELSQKNNSNFVETNTETLKLIREIPQKKISREDIVEESYLEKELVSRPEPRGEEFAVIAMAGRFPKSPNIEAYWKNLCNGEDLIQEIDNKRIPLDEYYNPDVNNIGTSYSKWAGIIEGVDLFDNEYFGITEDDAIIMDPQQRVLMELAQHLFDHGGYTKDELNNSSVGVFIGGGSNNYYENASEFLTPKQARKLVVGKIPSMIPARLSNYYNLKGPAITTDTACSSSLIAIHQACASIKENECEMAVAGGIFLPVDKHLMTTFSSSKVLAKDGRCKVFDKKANGIVLGEGAGLILIKKLHKAIEDGDQIFGVIKGSAINNDGSTMGITAPNIKGQENVIREALKDANVCPSTIGYLEAHGTGTLLGDPIEVKAAANVYSEHTHKKGYCKIGSVKSNMGHLLTSSGVSGIIKVLLSLHHKTIVPTLHCDEPHPRFGFGDNPFVPASNKSSWDLENGERRAAISSFGFSGTNCHIILEEMKLEYIPTRKSFNLTPFNRKRFWFGKKVISETELEVESILNEIYSGEITRDMGLEIINRIL